jgi:hypothetical protein
MYLLFIILFVLSFTLIDGKIINQNSIIRPPNSYFNWNIKLFIMLFLIFFISAIRDSSIGTDYHNYINFYEYIYNTESFPRFLKRNEIGWDYLNYFFAINKIPYQLFFGFISFIIYYFFIKGSYKYQYLLPLMFFFILSSGFFYWTLSGLRQSIAIMIFFYSIKFIIEKNFYQYILFIIIASFFHTSALIMIPIYFLIYLKFNQLIIFIIFSISLFFIGKTTFLEIINQYVLIIGNKIDFLNKYMNYLETSTFQINDERSSTGLGVIVKIITTYYIIYKSKYVIDKFPDLKIYFLLFIISAISNNLFYSVEIIGRVMNYLYISFPLVMAAALYYTNKKIEKYINLVFLSIYFLLFLVTTYKIIFNF